MLTPCSVANSNNSQVLQMSHDQNLREMSVKLIPRFTMCVKRELWELQFSLFFVIFRVKLAYFCVISREIAEITGIGHE